MALTSRLSILRKNTGRCASRLYNVEKDPCFTYEGWYQHAAPITKYYPITSGDDVTMGVPERNVLGSACCVMSPKEEHLNGDSGDWDEDSGIQGESETTCEMISSVDDYVVDSNPANIEQWLSEYFWNDSLRLVRAKNVSVKDFNAAMFGANDEEKLSSAPARKQKKDIDRGIDR